MPTATARRTTRKWIVVDCGVMFGRETTTPGVDLIMPDIRFLGEQRENILGIVLTHAHEDHIGAVARCGRSCSCPVYATPFTARLLRDKLREAGLRDERARDRSCRWAGNLTLGPFELEFITLTHSIPEPNALAIRTPLGIVLHTGDWKIDPDPLLGEATDDQRAAQARRRRRAGHGLRFHQRVRRRASPARKPTCAQALTDLIGTLKGSVAVTAFASNVARLDTRREGRARARPPGRAGRPLDAPHGRGGARDAAI